MLSVDSGESPAVADGAVRMLVQLRDVSTVAADTASTSWVLGRIVDPGTGAIPATSNRIELAPVDRAAVVVRTANPVDWLGIDARLNAAIWPPMADAGVPVAPFVT